MRSADSSFATASTRGTETNTAENRAKASMDFDMSLASTPGSASISRSGSCGASNGRGHSSGRTNSRSSCSMAGAWCVSLSVSGCRACNAMGTTAACTRAGATVARCFTEWAAQVRT